MVKKIKIEAAGIVLQAELNTSKTAEAIWNILPIETRGNHWGDEIYFSIPLNLGTEDGKEVVDIGDLAYWAPGNAFCLFFGRTPASQGDEVRPASAVTVIGKIIGDATALKKVTPGSTVSITQDTSLV